MMTDIDALKDNGLSVSCINLSCGYYNPHTSNEFTVIQDLQNCRRFIERIIENCNDRSEEQQLKLLRKKIKK